MSSYICDPITFNRIVAGLIHCTTRGGHPGPYPTTKYDAESMQISTPEQAKVLGQKLYEMNRAAYSAAYNGRYDSEEDITDDYGYEWVGRPSPVQLYKSIGALLYQCEEGDIDEWPLFKELQEFSHTLACYILEQTQEYEACEWR